MISFDDDRNVAFSFFLFLFFLIHNNDVFIPNNDTVRRCLTANIETVIWDKPGNKCLAIKTDKGRLFCRHRHNLFLCEPWAQNVFLCWRPRRCLVIDTQRGWEIWVQCHRKPCIYDFQVCVRKFTSCVSHTNTGESGLCDKQHDAVVCFFRSHNLGTALGLRQLTFSFESSVCIEFCLKKKPTILNICFLKNWEKLCFRTTNRSR